MKTRRDIIISLLVNIVLPSILCFLIGYILNLEITSSDPGYLMPLFFGIIIAIFNFKHYTQKIYFISVLQVLFVCVIISYLCLYLSIFLLPLFFSLISHISDMIHVPYEKVSISRLYIFTSVYIVAPVSVLWSFSYIFKYPKIKFTRITIFTFLVLFPVLGYLLKNVISSDTLQMLLWMPLMILPIQIILNQEKLKELLNFGKSQ